MVIKIKHNYNLSRVVRKPAFCICENKNADQLRGNREADQRLCFRHTDSSIPLLSKFDIRHFKPLAIFYGCTAWFVWDLVGNPEDRFSHNEAYLIYCGRLMNTEMFKYLPVSYLEIDRIYDGVQAETMKSQESFQIFQVSSEALPETSLQRPQHHH